MFLLRKKEFFSKPPNPELCMSLIGTPENDGTKSLNFVLNKPEEVTKLCTYCELIIDYVKRNVGKESNFKFDDLTYVLVDDKEKQVEKLPSLMSQITKK
jgi:hypothetical protein